MKTGRFKKLFLRTIVAGWLSLGATAGAEQNRLAITPPMGWMTWNYFGVNIHEDDIREMADAIVQSGMADSGYTYIYIDDGWQGGRDKRNNIIPDPQKFPSGMKALADYLHGKGLKLGIYSDAGQLSCAGYTASYGFEVQDAKTFASWGIDYLKYDYCNAPQDSATAQMRYKAMVDALRKSGRDIVFGICCQVRLLPWEWAAAVGGQLWRMGPDSRDKWENMLVVIGPGRWNDMCMLSVGMYGKGGPSWIRGTGCGDVEYQTQMSIWCMMAAPLTASCDIREMNEATRRILLNREIIALDQDVLGKQAERRIGNDAWNVFVKPLSNGDCAVAILNLSDASRDFRIGFHEIGLPDEYEIRDLWQHKVIGKAREWQGQVLSHETKVFRLKKI
jgi:alpha-galactosidase